MTTDRQTKIDKCTDIATAKSLLYIPIIGIVSYISHLYASASTSRLQRSFIGRCLAVRHRT